MNFIFYFISVGGYRQSKGQLKSAEIYNVKMDTFRNLPDMPYSVSAPCVAKSDDSKAVYLVGGYRSGALKTLMVYDIEESKFEKLPGEMSIGRSSSVCQAFKRTFVVVGGQNSKWAWEDSVDIYNIEEGTWKAGKVLPQKEWLFFPYKGDLFALHRSLSRVQKYINGCDDWKTVLTEQERDIYPKIAFHSQILVNRKELSQFC